MYNRVVHFFSLHKVFFKYQFGFRKHHSTSLALVELLDNLYTKLDEREIVAGIYLDLQKAFDTVDHYILLNKIYKYGIRGKVWDWFKSYLTNRKQFVAIGDINSVTEVLHCGVPQGSILGPLLFLIYVNDIKNCVTDCDVKLFADDTNVFVSGKSVHNVINQSNLILSSLSDWLVCNKLSISIDKTCYSLFGTNRKCCDCSCPLVINSATVREVNSTKYLGVIIDSSLAWSDHIDYIFNKLLKFVGIFYKLSFKLSPEILKQLYFAFIHPYISYGIEIYANACYSHLNKLILLNNKILRIIQRMKMTTPVRILYSNYNCLPIPLLHDYQLLLLVHKCMFHQNLLPEVFHDYFVCNSLVHSHCTRSSHNLHLYSIRSGFGSRCVKFKASQLWNELPADVRNIQSFNCFKFKLRKYLSSMC